MNTSRSPSELLIRSATTDTNPCSLGSESALQTAYITLFVQSLLHLPLAYFGVLLSLLPLAMAYDSPGTHGSAAQEEMLWLEVPLLSISLMFVVVVVLNITVGAMWVHGKAAGVQKQVHPPSA